MSLAAHPAHVPLPKCRGRMILYVQDAKFSQFLFPSLCSRFIVKPSFNRNIAKNSKLTSTVNTFNDFRIPLLSKPTPPKVKFWIRHWILLDWHCIEWGLFLTKHGISRSGFISSSLLLVPAKYGYLNHIYIQVCVDVCELFKTKF